MSGCYEGSGHGSNVLEDKTVELSEEETEEEEADKEDGAQEKKTSLASTESRLLASGWEWEDDVLESEKEP